MLALARSALEPRGASLSLVPDGGGTAAQEGGTAPKGPNSRKPAQVGRLVRVTGGSTMGEAANSASLPPQALALGEPPEPPPQALPRGETPPPKGETPKPAGLPSQALEVDELVVRAQRGEP